MNIYHASYYMSYGYGAFDEYECLIVANTEAEALGFALEAEPNTKAAGWSITEIDISVAGSHYLSSRSN